MRYLIVFLVVWDLASSCWKMKCWFFEILCIRNYTRQHMGTVRMLININSWFNKVNLCLAKLRSISWGHYTIRMTWTLSTISFLWGFRFLPNIWVNLGGTRIYCMRFTVNNFFVCEPWFIDLFDCLCAAVFWLLLPFLKSHLWLNFWSFLFWMVLILKFKSCLIMPHPVNLDIVVACRFQWESGSSSWLSICSFTAAIFSQFWPTTSLNTTNETVESIFPIVYWVHHESTLC